MNSLQRGQLPAVSDYGCLMRFIKCLQGSAQYRRAMEIRAHRHGVNSVSKIDKVSRTLFPLSFIILNVIYWIAYT